MSEGVLVASSSDAEAGEYESLVEQVEAVREAEQVQAVLLLFILLLMLLKTVWHGFSGLFSY